MTSLIQDTEQNNKCAGKNCIKTGKNSLVIKYINKRGNFCDSCSKDLLEEELATHLGAGIT